MKLNRRDVMKMSVLGGAALALPLERAMGEELTQANRIAESALPAPRVRVRLLHVDEGRRMIELETSEAEILEGMR